MYKMKIGGVTYEVSRDENGNSVYNPPLPEESRKKWDKNVKEMIRANIGPGLQTDTTWHKGRGTLLDQMGGDEVYTDYIVSEARKQGYNPGPNDVYLGQIAEKAGDREAFFKPSDGRAELKKRAIKKNMTIDAPGISVQGKDRPVKEKRLNPKFAENIAANYRQEGAYSNLSDKKLMEHVVNKHGRKEK